eukprot:TRINITY_DN21019_c0_g2_i1.p1 TRINITY_DN21019_c0_g2~~TRINITY_DN21019_c0_g2_i1.p1  ORF type:complete len:694 (-),score=192.79 TRINITY_DN21019_c0_g2_i1:113-1903(-)
MPQRDDLSVHASEDALLDLERAHEESGALRWALLRQILGDIRTKYAEVNAAIGEGQRHTSALDQQMLRERSAREAADAALKAEIAELRQLLNTEVHKVKHESKAELEETSTGIIRQVEQVAKTQREALQKTEATLAEALQAEAACRQRESDETLRCFEEIRGVMSRESKERKDALNGAAALSSSLQKDIATGAEARNALQARSDAADAALGKLGKQVEELASKLSSSAAALDTSLAEVGKKLQTESSDRATGFERMEIATRELVTGLEDKITSTKTYCAEHLASLAQVEALGSALRSLISGEAAAREALDAQHTNMTKDVLTKLEAEVAERRSSEEKVSAALGVMQDTSGREQRAREATAAECGQAVGGLTAKLEAQESRAQAGAVALQAEIAKLQEAFTEFKDEEVSARESACARIASDEDIKHKALAEELRRAHAAQNEESRQWATTLVERLSNDLHGERDELFQKMQSRCDELIGLNVERSRADLAVQMKNIDIANSEVVKAQQAMLAEERRHYEMQARTAAQEVKAALDAHGEFAEALEREQRLLKESMQECIRQDGQAHSDLVKRVGTVEFDMQKVKGHLPILFASPSAFR